MINIVGAVGKTERENRDNCRVMRGGVFNNTKIPHIKRAAAGVEKMEKEIKIIGLMDVVYELNGRVHRGGVLPQ